MSRKLTQSEAEFKSLAKGFTLVDMYVNSHTHVGFLCTCGKTFFSKPYNIFQGSTCSCGHCYDLKVGDRFGQLTVIEVHDGSFGGCCLTCQCDCGKIKTAEANVMKRLRSCGRCKILSVGDQFYKLTVVDIISVGTVRCQCACGRFWKGYASALRKGNNKSCGKCGLFRNGVFTSFICLRLHKMVGCGKHNYFIDDVLTSKGNRLNIDICITDEKIAIEYNEWHWHKHKLDQDRDKLQLLLNAGWRVLVIQAHNNLPSKDELLNALNSLRSNQASSYIITLDGWGI